jgi:CIC family chloride channel protein
MTGGFFGWAAGNIFPTIAASPAAYALVGMGGVVAGATHAPITAILIIFEMTGDYKIILPMMITCIISTIAAQGLKSGSIYTIKLRRRGIDIAGGLEQNILKTMPVKSYMRSHVVTVPESMPLGDLIDTFKNEDVSYLHVVDDENELIGIISFRDVRGLLAEEGLKYLVIAKDVATTNPVTVGADDNIQHALKLMSKWGISQLPVVDGQGKNTVLGVLREKDVVAAYDKAIIRREIETT